MDLPFDYVVFYLLGILKYRNKPVMIKKDNLRYSMIMLINLIDVDDETIKKFINEFDIDEEINTLINNYFEYLDYEDNYLILEDSISLSDIDDILSSISEDYDEELIEEIKIQIDNNYKFLELIGIKIQKQIAKNLIDLETEIEKAYNDFPEKVDDCKFNYYLKKILFKRKIFNMAIKNNINIEDYYDICVYISNLGEDSLENNGFINFMAEDSIFIQDEISNNPYLNAIFLNDQLAYLNITKRIGMSIEENATRNLKYSENKFYVTFLNFLEEEMSCLCDKRLYYEFRTCKYRVMNVLDSVCDTLYILGDKDNISDGLDVKEDYSFIYDIVFFLIDDVLMYNDEKYAYDEDDYFNLVTYYYNIVKKTLIKTYYYLTSDDKIIDAIKNNLLYGVNQISTGLLNDVINGDNKKKAKKRN